MSQIGDILDAIVVHAEAAISGVTVSLEAVGPDVNEEDLPFLTVLQTQYDVDFLPWAQENRIWVVSGALYQNGGTGWFRVRSTRTAARGSRCT
jgi:hypothetical protein